jgi:hypothetical protein
MAVCIGQRSVGFFIRLTQPAARNTIDARSYHHIGLVYLSLDLAKAGTRLEVEVLGERVSAQVAETPLVDPKGEKLRA